MKEDIEKLLSEAIGSISLAICIAEENKQTNEQYFLNLMDEVNKLSVKY